MPGVVSLTRTALPLNRKEKFWTGTVLPMLLCADHFSHFDRFTELAGLGRVAVDAAPATATIQFFTEYSFVESLVGEAKAPFPEPPGRKHTPDVLVFIERPRPMLIGVEAKMYHRPTGASLARQIEPQAQMLDYIGSHLGVAPSDRALIALLPEALAREMQTDAVTVVTWEQLLDRFGDIGEPYFVELLRLALSEYPALRSRSAGGGGTGTNAPRLPGAAIVDRHLNGTLGADWMGRNGGIGGKQCSADIASGGWRQWPYQYSNERHNRNWFSVADFVAQVRAPGSVDGHQGAAP